MTVIGKINGILASIKWALTEKCNRTVCHIVVAVAFQITFRVKMHVNDDFLFFKKSFLILAHQNDPKHIKYIKF